MNDNQADLDFIPNVGKKKGKTDDTAFNEIADFLNSQKIEHQLKNDSATVDLKDKTKKKIGYDPDKTPVDVEAAYKHAKASGIAFVEITNEPVSPSNLCFCCGMPSENEKFPLCSDISEFSILGSGFPLFLQTFSMLSLFLLQSLLLFGLFDLISNYVSSPSSTNSAPPPSPSPSSSSFLSSSSSSFASSSSSKPSSSSSSFLLRLSLPSKESEPSLLIIQSWLVFVSILFFHVCFQLYLRYQKLTEREANRGLTSPASFTIMIDYMFDSALTSQKVLSFLHSSSLSPPSSLSPSSSSYPPPPSSLSHPSLTFPPPPTFPPSPNPLSHHSFNIKKIVLSYKITDYVSQIQAKKKHLTQKRKSFRKKGIPLPSSSSPLLSPSFLPSPPSAISSPSNLVPSGTVFVTFETIKETQEFLSKYKFSSIDKLKWMICSNWSSSSKLIYNGIPLYIEQAKQPNDILWENLGFRFRDRLKKRFKTLLASFLLLSICFAVILAISIGKQRTLDGGIGGRVLGGLGAVIVVMVNWVLMGVMRQFAEYEGHYSVTHFNVSIARGLTIASFLNTAIILFLVHYLLDHKLNDTNGLITDMFSLFLANLIIPPIINLLDPFYFLRLIERKSIEKKPFLYTQQEAHEAFEGPSLELWRKYPPLIKTLWTTGFYATLIPIVIPIGIVTIFVQYWTDKYLITRRYKRPPFFSSDLNAEMMTLIELFPLSIAAGNIIFNEMIWPGRELSQKIPDILCLIMAGLPFILPSKYINRFICPTPEDVYVDLGYDSVKNEFLFDYDKCNPIIEERTRQELKDGLTEKSRGLQILFENLGLEAEKEKKDNFLDYYAENKAGMKHDRKELLTSMFIRRKIA